jgi:serine protease Do
MNTRKSFITWIVVAAVMGVAGTLAVSHNSGGASITTSAVAAPKTEAAPPSDARQLADQLSGLFESASEAVGPSVVPIFAEQTADAGNDQMQQFFGDEFFRRFFNAPGQGGQGGWSQTVRSMGSGVIMSSDGYILTNNHVVSGAEKLTVVLGDDKRLDAKIVGTDPQTDVAVIKVDAKDLPVAKIGNSDDTRVGQWVIAVGNPFQLLHSVTAGIVSAKGRSSVGLAAYEDFIQTDASINPGNSGGALADLDGNVIGINTAISSPSGANAGVGFAIPINMARNVMESLIANGKVSRGYLALVPQDLNEDLARAMGVSEDGGALVGDVKAGGPSDQAGIKRGDIITEFDGHKVKDATDLRKRVAETAPDSRVDVKVVRDGHPQTLHEKLDERPDQEVAQRPGMQQKEELEKGFGLGLQELTPEVAHQLGYEQEKGALVATVAPGSPADDAGLRRGDLIQEVDHHPVDDVAESVQAMKKADHKNSVLLLVRRGENTFFSAIKVS